jgi:hypothetical protein
MALEFSEAAVLGLDLVPSLTKAAPPNCKFRTYDINDGLSAYYSTFDVVHMRSVTGGVSWSLLTSTKIPGVEIRF